MGHRKLVVGHRGVQLIAHMAKLEEPLSPHIPRLHTPWGSGTVGIGVFDPRKM